MFCTAPWTGQGWGGILTHVRLDHGRTFKDLKGTDLHKMGSKDLNEKQNVRNRAKAKAAAAEAAKNEDEKDEEEENEEASVPKRRARASRKASPPARADPTPQAAPAREDPTPPPTPAAQGNLLISGLTAKYVMQPRSHVLELPGGALSKRCRVPMQVIQVLVASGFLDAQDTPTGQSYVWNDDAPPREFIQMF